MDQDFKVRWCDALRSGKYRKGIGQMRRKDNTFEAEDVWCCLGVGCDLYDPTRWATDAEMGYIYLDLTHDSVGYFPKDVADAIGVSKEDQIALAIMNDQPDSSLFKIADYIESNL